MVWSPDQYSGERELTIGLVTPVWLAFLSAAPRPVRRLTIGSRVVQEVVDALAGQPQLEVLELTRGPYHDLAPLSGLARLEELTLGGATKVVDLAPLEALTALRTLTVDEAHSVADLAPSGG